MNGRIFNIQKFCTSDGPGIRTTVFIKGCPLRCIWCHNPESQLIDSELMYDSNNCSSCLRCISVCPRGCHSEYNLKHEFDRKKCISCGECTLLRCSALEIVGYETTAQEVIRQVMKDKLFYDNSKGGITLSGGEPLVQFEFCIELLKLSKQNNLHICMETCGYAEKFKIIESSKYVDIFLFDYKETNPEKHRKFTGVDNTQILENLNLLDTLGKSIILRCPIIPRCNDTDEHFAGIAKLANTLENIIRIELEPYHSFGSGKYLKLGREYLTSNSDIPDEQTVLGWIDRLHEMTSVEIKKA